MHEGNQNPWLRAHELAQTLSITEVVVRLRSALGAKLVAYIAQANNTSIVRAWAEETAHPEPDEDARLRIAVEAFIILAENLDVVTISTWFQGMNPLLSDESPARLIRNFGPLDAEDVLVAAKFMLLE